MLKCPNKNSQDWKNLVRKYGEESAYNIYVLNNYEIPVNDIFDNKLSSPKAKDNNDNIAAFINVLDKRLSSMYDNIRNEKDFSKKEAIKERINKIEEKLDILKTTKNINIITDIANTQLQDAKILMSKDVLKESELNEVYKFINTYSDISDRLLTDEAREKQSLVNKEGEIIEDRTQIYKDLVALELEIKEMSSKFFDLTKQSILNDAKQNINENLTEEEVFGDLKDITWLSMQSRDAASQGKVLLSLMNLYHRFAMNKTDQETELLHKERVEQFNKVKDNPIFKANGWDIFFQKNTNGKEIRNLVNIYTSTYWELRNKYVKNIRSKDPIKIKKGLKWYKDNHFFIDYTQFLNEDLTINEDKLNTYKEVVKEEFGENRAEEISQEVADKYESFLTERNSKEIDLNNTYGENTLEKTKALYDWDISNSPLIGSQEILSGKILLNSSSKYSKKEYYQYMVAKPKNKEEFYDKDYQIIENDSQLLEYYNYLSKNTKDFFKIIPDSFIKNNGVKSNFIAAIKKSYIEQINTEGTRGFFKGANQHLIQSFTESKESDTIHNEIDIKTGKADYSLPIYFLNNPTKFNSETEQWEDDYSDLSKNLDKIMQASIDAFTTYKYKSLVEDKVKVLKHFGDNLEEDVNKIDNLGKKVINKQGLVRTKTLLDYQFDVFYDKAIDKQEGITDTKWKTTEEKETDLAITNKIGDLNTALQNETLQQEERESLENRVDQLKDIQSNIGRNFSWSKSFRWLLGYVQTKSQAFNLMSATNELIFGQLSAITHAQGKVDYNIKQWGTAFKLLASQDKKSKALCNRFKIVTQIADYDNIGSKLEKGLYYFQEGADHMSKGVPLIAMMMNTNITTKSGEVINLFQAYDKEGNFNEELFDEETNRQWNPFGTEGFERTNFYKFQNKITQLNKKFISGNYDRDSRILARKNVMGYALTQFRVWMIEGYAQRFQENAPDHLLGRDVKGRYRTAYEIYQKQGLGKLMTMLFKQATFQESAFDALDSPTDIENMRKNLAELYTLLSVIGLGALLLKATDDDDEKENFAINYLTNAVFRIQTDIMFYSNPAEFEKINKSILPVLRIYDDVQQLKESFIKLLKGEDEIQGGIYKGWSRFGKEGLEFFPITTPLMGLNRQVHEVLGDK